MLLKLGIQYRALEYYQVCSNDDPRLIFDFLARLNNVQEELLYYPWCRRRCPQMLKFCVKVLTCRTSLFPNHMMYLVHVWYDDRYWSKIWHSNIPTPLHIHDLKVKVTNLEFLCLIFALKFLEFHYFQTLWCIWFMFGMMIDIGPKFYAVASPPPTWP